MTESDQIIRLALAAREAHKDAQMAKLALADARHDLAKADAVFFHAQDEFERLDADLRKLVYGGEIDLEG